MSGRGPGSRGVSRATREDSILRAATDEFGRIGYHGASVAAIARQADVSKALVLAYFGSKDELYRRCLDSIAAPLDERIADVVHTTAPGWPMALETLRTIFESLRDVPLGWALIHDTTTPEGSPARRSSLDYQATFRRHGITGVRATLGVASDDGDRRRADGDSDLLAEMWNSIVTSTMAWWCRHPDETPESLVARCERVLAALARS